MLAFAMGLPKSASSVVHAMVIAVLQHSGHDQTRWRSEVLPALAAAHSGAVSKTGFMSTDFTSAVLPALKASGLESFHAVKTNGGLVQKCKSLLDVGLIKAVATYRDPGEAAVSLLQDVDRQIAEGGPDRARLAHIVTLGDAIDHIAARTNGAATWLQDPRVLKLDYSEVKSNPAGACEAIANYLGVKLPDAKAAAEAAGAHATSVRPARFSAEADAHDQAHAQKKFGEYAALVARLTMSKGLPA